jgi:hypothetical protein
VGRKSPGESQSIPGHVANSFKQKMTSVSEAGDDEASDDRSAASVTHAQGGAGNCAVNNEQVIEARNGYSAVFITRKPSDDGCI